MIEIEFDYRATLSVNHVYWHRNNKIMKQEARTLRARIQSDMKANKELQEDMHLLHGDYKEGKLAVKIEIGESWFTKQNTIRRKDISNREKFFIDSVFEALGLDDSQIFRIELEKVDSEKEFTKIEIWAI